MLLAAFKSVNTFEQNKKRPYGMSDLTFLLLVPNLSVIFRLLIDAFLSFPQFRGRLLQLPSTLASARNHVISPAIYGW
jgi:hypothetical protein